MTSLMRSNDEVSQEFSKLFSDISAESEYFSVKPLLTHYTSLSNLEAILRGKEMWLSSPLQMNDYDEVRFGFREAIKRIEESKLIRKEIGSVIRHEKFLDKIYYYYEEFANKGILKTFVFSLSQHKNSDNDGLLSMWRGYGSNGNGVALVFDSSKIHPVANSPFVIAKVAYGSAEMRIKWIESKIRAFSKILSSVNCSDDQLYIASYWMVELGSGPIKRIHKSLNI